MAVSYAQRLEDGHEFQDFVGDELAKIGVIVRYYTSRQYQYQKGESANGIEIKLDRLCTTTGRLSIEIGEKQPQAREYVPSGIRRKDNSWLYVQGNGEVLYVFAKNMLQLLEATGRYPIHCEPTIKKFYLPLVDAAKYAAMVIRPSKPLSEKGEI